MLPTRSLFTVALSLLAHETAAFPALDPTPITAWTRNLNPLSWRISQAARRDSVPNLEKRQGQGDGTAFDRNPDGSAFLWVLQDTYEGEGFFE